MNKNLVKLGNGVEKLGEAVRLIDVISTRYFSRGVLNIELTKSFCIARDMLYDAEDIINNSFYKYIDSKNIKLK